MNMKRIAFILITTVSILSACSNERPVIDPDPDEGGSQLPKNISIKVHVPGGNANPRTYADESATNLENRIDTLYVDLYQAGVLIDQNKFSGTALQIQSATNDSILTVGYEVDNISTGTLTAKVFANFRGPQTSVDSIPLPKGNTTPPLTSFFMSGKTTLASGSTGAYQGEVHLERNVAKVRVLMSKNNPSFPADLKIGYEKVKIQVLNMPNRTDTFSVKQGGNSNQTATLVGVTNINLAERPTSPTGMLHNAPGFVHNSASSSPWNNTGGQIDSFYIYENLRSTYNTGDTTRIKLTIPTIANGVEKFDTYTYDLNPLLSSSSSPNQIYRNTIYTLNIKVQGQGLKPSISFDVLPWDDVNLSGSIQGTYLTTESSEIDFNDLTGEATINFCTDAQAVYFDFSTYNANNPNAQIGPKIDPIGIDTNVIDPLVPAGYKDGQILLQNQRCGSFKFKLKDMATNFPSFPAGVNFSGTICMKAGNIVKCFSFPARRIYDAHFIVGDTLFAGEAFTNATVSTGATSWMQVSQDRLWTTNHTNAYSGTARSIYLHLDENLGTSVRTGTISFINASGAEKEIKITQLPAIPVGRFGNPTAAIVDTPFTAKLYTEQLYEYKTMPYYSLNAASAPNNNSIYNGRGMSFSNIDHSNYFTSPYFLYYNSTYQAMAYCAYKNRDASFATPLANDDIKWHLPSQSELMAMWISFETYKNLSTTNFFFPSGTYEGAPADAYWSATNNPAFTDQAQYMNFKYGSVGHIYKAQKMWVRCVRSAETTSGTMVTVIAGNTTIDFTTTDAMPSGSYTSTTKKPNGTDRHENHIENQTLYHKLRVANADANGITYNWVDAEEHCRLHYSEAGAGTGTWRLPTQRELQAIWLLQTEAGFTSNTSFTPFAAYYYWTATSSYTSGDPDGLDAHNLPKFKAPFHNAWMVWMSTGPAGEAANTPHTPKVGSPLGARVRCVYEVP
ncbi:MAG: DUF1566 domain-containing protein [Tannerella sp.]|nr:DUF1566 domain-containing protein [Tannerella sp.]